MGGGEPSRRDGVRPQEARGKARGSEVSAVHVLEALSREETCVGRPDRHTRGRACARMSEGVSSQRHTAGIYFCFSSTFFSSWSCQKSRPFLHAPPSDL